MGGLISYVNISELRKEQIIMKRYGYHRTSTREQHLDCKCSEVLKQDVIDTISRPWVELRDKYQKEN